MQVKSIAECSFIKLPFVIKIFVLSFELPFYTGFTVHVAMEFCSLTHENGQKMKKIGYVNLHVDRNWWIFSSVFVVDWLQSLKQFFINVSYHILVASLTLMAMF